MDADTAPIIPEVVAPAPGGLLGGLLDGLDMPAMLASMGVELPDPDAATIDDVDESIAELHAKFDWLAAVLVAAIAKAPARFAPDLPPYPSTD